AARDERALEPGVEIAAVRERTALADSPLVDAVHEEAVVRLRSLGLVEDSHRAGGADHQRRALEADTARTEVRADAVEPYRHVRDRRQARRVEAEPVEQLGI